MKKSFLTILILCAFMCKVYGQTLTGRVEFTGASGKGTYAPMWHMINKQGVSSIDACMGYMRNGIGGKHLFARSGISLDWNFDLISGTGLTSHVYIQQAHLDINWKRVRVSLGQKERWGDFKNHRLSTGALTESGNARPVPQIRIELPEYWNIPGTEEWLGLRGHIAYGWFTDENWQKDFVAENKARTTGVRYHTKSGFLRVGNEKKFPLTAEVGLHMATQFGGNTYNRGNHDGLFTDNPTRLKDYLIAFLPTKGDKLYVSADQANIAGNVLGSYLGVITWNSNEWMIRLNYEHVFDDHSQMFWEYGMWTEQLVGIELDLKRFRWLKAITIEYFNLKNQSGPIYHDSTDKIPDQISCRDNNYSHHTYNGWFNYGMMMGTPLVSSPLYNTDGTLIIYNNRVEAFHFGVEGYLADWIGYRMLITRSNNWGTYSQPFTEIKQDTSGLIEITLKPDVLKSWSLTASFAFDKGDLYGDNYGAMLTLKREFEFSLKK